jgi:hypothetical protein
LFIDSHGFLLEEHFIHPNQPLPARVKTYLDALGFGNNIVDQQSTFTQVVIAAHQHGIRIVPLETDESYSPNNSSSYLPNKEEPERYSLFSYQVAQVYSQYKETKPEGKCVFYYGSAHVRERQGYPGIEELTHCPSLLVAGTLAVNTRYQVQPDVTVLKDENQNFTLVREKIHSSPNISRSRDAFFYRDTNAPDRPQEEQRVEASTAPKGPPSQ